MLVKRMSRQGSAEIKGAIVINLGDRSADETVDVAVRDSKRGRAGQGGRWAGQGREGR